MREKGTIAMYKCEFSKIIWGNQNKTDLYEVVVKDLTLPFPPYLGLSVSSGRFKSGIIVSVGWDNDREVFSVGVEAEIPYEDDDYNLVTAEFITKHLLKRRGWEILDVKG